MLVVAAGMVREAGRFPEAIEGEIMEPQRACLRVHVSQQVEAALRKLVAVRNRAGRGVVKYVAVEQRAAEAVVKELGVQRPDLRHQPRHNQHPRAVAAAGRAMVAAMAEVVPTADVRIHHRLNQHRLQARRQAHQRARPLQTMAVAVVVAEVRADEAVGKLSNNLERR